MTNELGNVLGDLNFPTTEIDITLPVENKVAPKEQVSFDDVVETDSNQMLVEGVDELKDHPELEDFLRNLNDLKNNFVSNVEGLSEKVNLTGSVKVLFAVQHKE